MKKAELNVVITLLSLLSAGSRKRPAVVRAWQLSGGY
jgi:hypothetical protein